MRRLVTTALPMLLLAAGCGSDQTAASDSSPLLRVHDLPSRTTTSARATGREPCSPIAQLKGLGARVAVSPTFLTGEARTVQAVGTFDDPQGASEAFRAITSVRQRDCVAAALREEVEQRSGHDDPVADTTAPLPGGGRDATSTSYVMRLPEALTIRVITMSVRISRGVSTLAVFSIGPAEEPRWARPLADRATHLLREALQEPS